MYSSKLKINLLAISVLAALFPTLTLAANLTVEQRLQLLEAELSANKKNFRRHNHSYLSIKIKCRRWKLAYNKLKGSEIQIKREFR